MPTCAPPPLELLEDELEELELLELELLELLDDELELLELDDELELLDELLDEPAGGVPAPPHAVRASATSPAAVSLPEAANTMEWLLNMVKVPKHLAVMRNQEALRRT